MKKFIALLLTLVMLASLTITVNSEVGTAVIVEPVEMPAVDPIDRGEVDYIKIVLPVEIEESEGNVWYECYDDCEDEFCEGCVPVEIPVILPCERASSSSLSMQNRSLVFIRYPSLPLPV